jgi:GMP synthase (glutamine-hydrolysing)
MKPIVILEHNPEVPPGYLADTIAAAGLPSKIIRLYDGDELPDLDSVSAVVSLGGVMGAYDEEEFPFLAAEKVFLRKAVDRDVPVLGICLGCQMLADALGGSAFKADKREVEFAALGLEAADDDPVLRTLARPVVSFHHDTWTPPPGVAVLASSALYPHAFRYRNAVAIQSHPEASPEMVALWVERTGRDKLEADGVDPDGLLESIRSGARDNEARAAELFGAWLREVQEIVRG